MVHSDIVVVENVDIKDNLNDVKAQPTQNFKTVECRLKCVYEKLAATEAKIFMFDTMKNLGIATNDVWKFVIKQSSHKRVNC